jgi:hypothetical protein
MAADDTAALIVALSAQVSQFQKDLDNAAGIADKSARKIEDRFAKMNLGGSIDGLIGKLRAVVAGGAIGELVSQVVDLNEQVAQIGNSAARVGLSTDEFQTLRYAIVETGGSVESADQFMNMFARSIGLAATGQGNLYNFLKVNNVALRDQNGQLLPTNTLLAKYADLVKNTKSPQDQLNEAMMVGGRMAGPALVAVLKEGSAGLAEFGVQAHDAGVILDKDLIAQAQRTAEEFSKLKMQSTAAMESLAVAIATKIAGEYEDSKRQFTAENQDIKTKWQTLVDYVKDHPVIFTFLSFAANAISSAADKAQQSAAGLLQNKNFSIGTGLLKAGQGAPIGDLSKFPGYQPSATDDQATVQYNKQADDFKKLMILQEDRIRLLGAETAAIGLAVGPATEMEEKIKLETAAKKENIPITTERQAAIDAEAAKLGAAAQALDDYKRHWQNLNSALQFGGDQAINIIDGLRNHTLTAATAATQLADAFLHAAEQALLLGSGPLANIFGMQSNVAGGTGGIFGLLGKLFAFRSGGVVPGFAPGGMLSGPGTGTSDSMLIRASSGEYIVNADATARYRNLLDAINNGSLAGFADGGIVMPSSSIPSVSSGARQAQPAITIVQQFTNNFSSGINGTDRAALSAEMRQAAQTARMQAVNDAKNLRMKRAS